jgi:hypothetical protein
MAGTARDSAPPFFDRLLRVGEDGKYKPELAQSWDISKDGKAITFKLRQGVTFHDGTPFNAQAVKANLDNLIPPKATLLSGIDSVDVVEDYTVKLTLPSYNNLILHHFAANPATYMYSPDWHHLPKRQLVILLEGELEVEIGDGTQRRFSAGDVFLCEDTTGQGHKVRGMNRKTIVVQLA